MSTYDHYVSHVPAGTWDVSMAGASRFSWEYDNGRSRLPKYSDLPRSSLHIPNRLC